MPPITYGPGRIIWQPHMVSARPGSTDIEDTWSANIALAGSHLMIDMLSATILTPLADQEDSPLSAARIFMMTWALRFLSPSAIMAPTPSPTPVHLSNTPLGRHHHLRRQMLGSSHHLPEQSLASHTERLKPRTLDPASQPSVALEGPTPPPFAPTLASEPSTIPVNNSQPGDIPGNIVAAVGVIVLVLGGLLGLIVGGELLRRHAKTAGKRASPPPSSVERKSKLIKNATGSPQQCNKTSREGSPYDEKTLTPLARPAPALNMERQRRLVDIWPIRSLSRALCNRRSCPEQVARSRQHSAPVANPQTTWSEFSPVTLYVPPRRTVLADIPEEHEEDCQSQTSRVGRPPERGSVVSTPQANQPESAHGTFLVESGTTERHDPQNGSIVYEAGVKDEDAKSLESSAPDMTLDGGESSRSSMVSLESLGDEQESLKDGVFELRRAQTRSMQMNKGVLLSLNLKTVPEHGSTQCGPSRPPSTGNAGEGGKEHDVELSLAMLGGSFSAVDLDEFPSPPSILPVIPSFVSGF